MPQGIDWGSNGYIQVPEEGDGATGRAVKGIFDSLNAAPDARLVQYNLQSKGDHPIVVELKKENQGYEHRPERNGPGRIRTVLSAISNLSAAPEPTADDLDNAEMRRVKREANLTFRQKGLVADLERKFEERQIKEDARYEIRRQRAAKKGAQRGLKDNEQAEWREEKLIEARGFVVNMAKGSGSLLKSGLEFVGRKVFKKGNGGTVDSSFVDES